MEFPLLTACGGESVGICSRKKNTSGISCNKAIGSAEMSKGHSQVTSSPSHPIPKGALAAGAHSAVIPLSLALDFRSQAGMLSLPAVGGLSPWQSSRSQFAAFPIQGFISGEAELSGRLLSKVAIKVTPPAVIFSGFTGILVPKS